MTGDPEFIGNCRVTAAFVPVQLIDQLALGRKAVNGGADDGFAVPGVHMIDGIIVNDLPEMVPERFFQAFVDGGLPEEIDHLIFCGAVEPGFDVLNAVVKVSPGGPRATKKLPG